jgi:hypothetical protein
MFKQRLTTLVKIKQAIEAETLGVFSLRPSLSTFDPDEFLHNQDAFPKLSITSENELASPSNIYGYGFERTFSILILGWTLVLSDIVTDFGVSQDAELKERLVTSGELLVDAIIEALGTEANANAFANCFGTHGFSISSIGPVLVDHWDFESELAHMRMIVTTEFQTPPN